MEEEEWVMSCLADELLVGNECIPFSRVEKEVLKLLRTKRRTHDENIRLAILYEAMKDYLRGMEILKEQLQSSQSYLGRILSWWSGEESSTGTSGASVTRRGGRRKAERKHVANHNRSSSYRRGSRKHSRRRRR